MAELVTLTPTDIHVDTIDTAIALAESEPENALTVEVYKALAALAAKPETSGTYQVKLAALAKSNSAFSKTEIRKHVEAVTALPDAIIDDADQELRHGVEPWNEPVDGLSLYRTLTNIIERHCFLPSGGSCAVSLWVMASYSIDSFRLFPKLLIHSPQKRCGKTTLLEVLQALMPKALSGSNVTPSVIFRAIELWGVSILLDEVDTFLRNSDDLRGIVNSGHTRSGAFVWRTEGDAVKEPKRFSTWAPMVLAMIGNPPPTVLDRSIIIGLSRKKVTDVVERIPQSMPDDCLEIRRKLTRWANDNTGILRISQPAMPHHENDRAVDNWTALFSVAELVGAGQDVRAAMATLEVPDDDNDDLSVELLRDLQELVESGKFSGPTHTSTIVKHLLDMADRPWGECNRGRPLTPNKMAYLLKPYKVAAKPRSISGKKVRTLDPSDLIEVFSRYIPPKVLQFRSNGPESASDQRFSGTELHEQFRDGTNLQGKYVPLKATSDAVSGIRNETAQVFKENTEKKINSDEIGDTCKPVKSAGRGGVL